MSLASELHRAGAAGGAVDEPPGPSSDARSRSRPCRRGRSRRPVRGAAGREAAAAGEGAVEGADGAGLGQLPAHPAPGVQARVGATTSGS